MNYRRIIIGVATAGLAAGMVAATAPSAFADNPKNPTNLVDNEFPFASGSAAFNLSASGNLLNISPTKVVVCDGESSSNSANLATLNAGAIGTVKALNDNCSVSYSEDGDSATSSQTIASASLLGGRIKLTGIDSQCSAGNGVASVGSVVATINGQRPTSGSGQVLNIPGLATVVINENHEVGGTMWTDAVHISVLPVYVHGHQVTPAQDIVVGSCSVSGTT